MDASETPASAPSDASEAWTQEQMLQFLLDLREGAEVGKAVAAMRPQRVLLGQHLDAWLDLFEANLLVNTATRAQPFAEAQEMRRAATPTHDDDGEPDDDVLLTAWRVGQDTLAARDLAAWRADGWPEELLQPYREQDEGPALRFAHRITDAAIDHLRGVAVMMKDERLSRPPLALSRVVLDAAAHLNHVLQPGIDAEERVIRLLNESLSRAGEDFRAASREQDQARMDEAEDEITSIFKAVGARRRTRWNRDRGLPYLGEKPAYTSKMIDELLGGAGLWSPLSDVVHNKEDDGWRIMLGLTFGTGNPHKDSYIALHSLGAVLGVVTLTGVIESYTAWDLSATREANDPLCQLWAAGAGMLDDVYRDQAKEQRRSDGSTERLAQIFALAAERIADEGGARRADDAE